MGDADALVAPPPGTFRAAARASATAAVSQRKRSSALMELGVGASSSSLSAACNMTSGCCGLSLRTTRLRHNDIAEGGISTREANSHIKKSKKKGMKKLKTQRGARNKQQTNKSIGYNPYS